MSDQQPLMALFGGTFDPFHRTHAWVCHEVLAHPEIDQLRLIPCQIPALKGAAQAPAENRVEMLQAWVSEQGQADRLLVDRRELDRSGPSFTVDTIKSLRRDYPDWRFVFVLGGDAFASLPRWEGVNDLLRETHFWVFGRGRDGVRIPDLPITEVAQLTDLGNQRSGLWFRGADSQSDLASSTLRNQRADWRASLPPVIYHYIQQHGLYRSPDDGNSPGNRTNDR